MFGNGVPLFWLWDTGLWLGTWPVNSRNDGVYCAYFVCFYMMPVDAERFVRILNAFCLRNGSLCILNVFCLRCFIGVLFVSRKCILCLTSCSFMGVFCFNVFFVMKSYRRKRVLNDCVVFNVFWLACFVHST